MRPQLPILLALVLGLCLDPGAEAGILATVAGQTEALAKRIQEGAVKLEHKVTSLFVHRPTTEVTTESVLPTTTPTAARTTEPNTEPTTTPIALSTTTTTMEIEVPTMPVVRKAEVELDVRYQIEGVPRCGPGEIFTAGECRLVTD